MKARPWEREVIAAVSGIANHRTIKWIYTRVGNVGKSRLASFLARECGAAMIDGRVVNDASKTIYCLYRDEDSPFHTRPIIVVDLARADSDEPEMLPRALYRTLESLKDRCNNGTGGSVPWQTPPHILVFANCAPAARGGVSPDRFNVSVIHNETHALVEPALTARPVEAYARRLEVEQQLNQGSVSGSADQILFDECYAVEKDAKVIRSKDMLSVLNGKGCNFKNNKALNAWIKTTFKDEITEGTIHEKQIHSAHAWAGFKPKA